jgi:predicted DNA-binding protein
MQKFTYQTCIRMPENLRESLKDICDTYQINESDYIRRSLAQSVQNDMKNTQSADNKFLFV